VWTAAADGTFLTISPRFTEITGLPPGPQRRAIHPDDLERVMREWEVSLAAGEPHETEFRMRVKDGAYRIFRVRSAPRRDEAGRIVGWYGVTEDVHGRRQADEARHEAEERYRLAVRATNDAIYDLDLVTREIRWRDSDSEFFGYSGQEEASPLSWWEEKLHPDDKAWVVQGFEAIIGGDQNRWSVSYRFRKADGDYARVQDQGLIVRDAEGRALRAVGAMSDVTRQWQAETEVQRIQAELIHVSRFSAMGTMAATLAHELNQPLTAVANFLGGAKRIATARDETPVQLLAALEAAESGAQRAGEIVRRLRELVSRGTVSVVSQPLRRLIEEACVLAFVDEKVLGIRHRLELDPAAAWVTADRVQIQQVLINLVRNAIDAMAQSKQREILISARAAGNMVEISVADSGPGIPPEDLENLFSQFMTTKSGGMGIGLPICRTIVEAHGGTIWAENRPEGGSIFRFTLPQGQPRSPERQEQARR
jgi:PAS domain S-box-containing protein